MSSTSTIPVVLDGIEDLFTAAFASSDTVQVSQGQPQAPARERVEVADVQNAPQEWETLGGLVHRSEQYLVTCWVIVANPAHLTFRDAKNRAFEILGTVEDALRVNDPLGLVASYAYFEVDFGGVATAHGGAATEGWAYEIEFTVRVEATI